METLNAEGEASGTWKDWRDYGLLGVNHGSGAWFDLDNNPDNGLELILAGGTTVEERINRDLKLWGAALDSMSYKLEIKPVNGTEYTLSDRSLSEDDPVKVIVRAESDSLEELVTKLRNTANYSNLPFTISADTSIGSIVATSNAKATRAINAKDATITRGDNETEIKAESLIDGRLGINPQFGAAAIQARDPGGVLPAYQNELILSAEDPGMLVMKNDFTYL